jgi:thioredoxin-related protein
MRSSSLFILILYVLNFKAQNEHGLVNWLTFKEAQEKNKSVQKPILIDVYTDWCGWCKHMMKTTYSNQVLAQYINMYFYPVKFDAEGKDTITYNGQTYYPTSPNPKTPHQLALKFLGSNLSYPSTIFVGSNYEFSLLTQGYLDDKKIEPLLVFMVENVFRTTTYEDFSERFNKTFYDTVFAKKPVKTYSVKEALTLHKKKPKKLLVNVYTGFCNSCKVMNKTTFVDTSIASYIDKNFYLVNFDAETADTIEFNKEKFSKQLVNGYPMNTFAFKITNGHLALPSLAILDEQLNTIDVLNMYQHPKNLKPALIYYGANHYKTKKWPDFYNDYLTKTKK